MATSDLTRRNCRKYNSINDSLDGRSINDYLTHLQPEWTLQIRPQKISHQYTFTDYYETIAFVNVVAQIAHQQNHHPELIIHYNQCIIRYNTHSVNGLSLNDFICAAKINSALKS